MKKLIPSVLCLCLFASALAGCAPEALDEPDGFELVFNRIVTWEEVEHAEHYTVTFMGEEYTTEACSFELPSPLPAGEYSVEVSADGTGFGRSAAARFSFRTRLLPNAVNEDFTYTLNEDGTGFILSLSPNGYNMEKIEINDFYNGLPVKQIGADGFNNSGFYVSTIAYLVEGNRYIREIKLPAQLEIIGARAFPGTLLLEEIDIPDTVTEIGKAAFEHCTALKRVHLPVGLKTIPMGCFEGCSLETLELPPALTTIEMSAFSGSDRFGARQSFTEVTFPASLTSIGSYAFANCPALTCIHYQGTTEQWALMERAYDWRENTPLEQVVCSDGILTGDDIG